MISNSCWIINKGDALFWMDKWHEDGILFNNFEDYPTTNLGGKVGDVLHHRDLFENQVGGIAGTSSVADM